MQINLFEPNRNSRKPAQPSKGKGIFFIIFGVLGVWAKAFAPGFICILVGIYFLWKGLRVTVTDEEEEDGEESFPQKRNRRERRQAFQAEMDKIDEEFSIPDEKDADE